jgi:ribose transport system permease protein
LNRPNTRQAQIASTLSHLISVWGLLLLLVALVVAFSVIKPDTFPTYFNFRSIVNNKSVQALLALAVFLPMTANHFDLSVGFLLGIAQVLVIGLQGQGLTWPLACAVVLLLGAAIGVANGILVTVIGIDSFIATLGTGTLLYGFNEWYTGGQQVVAALPDSFVNISGAVLGIPSPAIYVLVLSISLWVVFEYLPAGRYLYVLGASPRAAELNGISAKRYVTAAFLRPGSFQLSQESSSSRNFKSGRVRWDRNIYFRPSLPRSSALRLSDPAESMSGAQYWLSRFLR